MVKDKSALNVPDKVLTVLGGRVKNILCFLDPATNSTRNLQVARRAAAQYATRQHNPLDC